MNILGKRSDLPFSRKSDRKKDKSTVSFTHVQNIICSQTLLDGIAHEQAIICRHLFAGHVVGSRPIKRKKNLLRMIIVNLFFQCWHYFRSVTLHRLARLCELKFKFVNAQLQEKQLNYSFRVKRKRCNGDLWVAMKFLVSLVFVFPLNRVS